jgi:hypothetical protein
MTVNIYGHWIPGEGKRDLDQVLRGGSDDVMRKPRVEKRKRVVLD